MTIKTGLVALVLSVFVVAPATAQSTAPGPSGGKSMPSDQQDEQGRSESLSGKLDKSNGVITPREDIDPGMHVPAPDPHPNSTPVIPPSATGGNSAK